jgi:hypothetical protein
LQCRITDSSLLSCRILPDDHHLDRLAGTRVGHADGAAFENARMRRQHAFDLVRIDVETGHQDHVLLAVGDGDDAVLIHVPDVAGGQPAVAQHLAAVSAGLPQ